MATPLSDPANPPRRLGWVSRGVIGIILATFFSDVGHEMATATLPLYLASLGLGAAALGFVEGLADLLFSLAKLGAGWVGHHTERKRPLASLGYLATALGTAALGFTATLLGLASARGVAWLGRGFRSPLRDFMLADEVGSTHFGRAYGVERAADMLGAVAGPLLAAILAWAGFGAKEIILVSIVPSLVAAASFFMMTRDRLDLARPAGPVVAPAPLPRRFWLFVAGVGLFGMGDFSRTFLILLGAAALGADPAQPGRALSTAVLLYALHNLVSSFAAYPAGQLGDRYPKIRILVAGYAIGVVTNILLGFADGMLPLLVLAIALSGVYIAIEETVEKAVAAEMLAREQRSLGLGVLAAANAAGDMLSSVAVGLLIAAGRAQLAFLLAAGFGSVGITWILIVRKRTVGSEG